MFTTFAWSPDTIWVIGQKIWWFLIVIGVLISFHEFGHLLAARWVGVRVLKYSLGFGPKVFGRQIGETEYLVSAVPLGGYVKLFGEEEADALTREEQRRSFFHQALPGKMFIVAAGPGFNFLLAYLIFAAWLVTGAPLPVPTFPELSPVVKFVSIGSPAEMAGIQVGDRILRINDREISIQEEIFDAVQKSKGLPLSLDIQRGDSVKTMVVTPHVVPPQPEGAEEPFYRIGVEEAPPVLTSVLKNSPAMAAGFKRGDRVVQIEGQEITTWSEMTDIVRASPDKPLHVQVERDGTLVDLVVTPKAKTRTVNGEEVQSVTIGISRGPWEILRADSIPHAVVEAARATWKGTELIGYTLYKLVAGEVSRKSVAGPLGIASISGEAAEQGLETVIWLIAFLSINLGVLNLLPIPILDGGHLFFFALEGILRKPLGERQREIAQQVGLVVLICIFILALWNDIERLLSN